MLVENWKKNLLFDIIQRFGYREDLIQEIFSCHSDRILNTSFTTEQCFQIARKLDANFEDINERRINWENLRTKFIPEKCFIPEPYIKSAGTHMSSVRSVLTFFENRFTSLATQLILEKLDLNKDALHNDQAKVNNHFVNKMFDIMINDFNLNKSDIDLMSIVVHRYSMRSSVLAMIKPCQTNGEILRLMIENASKYEVNNSYSIEDKKNYCIITSTSRHEVKSSENKLNAMHPALINFKLSTFKHITSLIGRNPLNISAHETYFDHGHQILRIKIQDTDHLSSLRNSRFN